MAKKTIKPVAIAKNITVRNEVLKMLVDKMGFSKTSIFIRDNMSLDTDYLNMKDKLYAKKGVNELYSEIINNRKKG
jgi:hypothetical protein